MKFSLGACVYTSARIPLFVPVKEMSESRDLDLVSCVHRCVGRLTHIHGLSHIHADVSSLLSLAIFNLTFSAAYLHLFPPLVQLFLMFFPEGFL